MIFPILVSIASVATIITGRIIIASIHCHLHHHSHFAFAIAFIVTEVVAKVAITILELVHLHPLLHLHPHLPLLIHHLECVDHYYEHLPLSSPLILCLLLNQFLLVLNSASVSTLSYILL